MKKIIKREGSKVWILTDTGELWLTRRKKLKHDSSRRKWTHPGSVKHIPIKRIVQHGDWLFTCNMKPVQFDKWIEKNPADYSCNRDDYTQEEWDNMWKYDDFCSLDGGNHSREHCSLSLISTTYAEFFIKHQLWELYDLYNDFDLYEEAVKKVCEAYKIKYEGI